MSYRLKPAQMTLLGSAGFVRGGVRSAPVAWF